MLKTDGAVPYLLIKTLLNLNWRQLMKIGLGSVKYSRGHDDVYSSMKKYNKKSNYNVKFLNKTFKK